MNTFDKIEDLIKLDDLLKFQETVNDITDHLLLEGFEYRDVKEYLIRELNVMLGEN
jgi:hypothetical protein